MANFSNLSLTSSGIQALARAQAGTTLTLTKIGLGDGYVTSNASALTALVSPKLMLPISETYVDSPNGYMNAIAKMTNETVTEGFYWREIGMFFKNASGNDELFAYACITNDQYDYIPAYSDQRYAKQIRIANIISNTDNIVVEESQGLLYVDTITFAAYQDEVDEMFIKAIRNEAEGETIVLDDSAEAPLLNLKLFGKTKQNKTTGKNLLNVTLTTQTVSGVTFTVNSDSSITVDGTATDDIKLTIGTVSLAASKTYVLSGCPEGGSSTTYALSFEGIQHDVGSGKQVTTANAAENNIKIIIGSGTTVTNLTFYPMMLLYADRNTPYEPYSGGVESPNMDYPQPLEHIGVFNSDTNEREIEVNVALTGGTSSQTLLLSVGDGIPGIPVSDASLANYTDENGQMWCCDEIDFARGVYVQRIGRLSLDGTQSWANQYYTYGSTQTYLAHCTSLTGAVDSDAYVLWSDRLIDRGNTYNTLSAKYEMCLYADKIYVKLDEEMIAYDVKMLFTSTPAEVMYILATPVEKPLSDCGISTSEIEAYKAIRTYDPATTITNDCDAYMSLEYFRNTVNGNAVGRVLAEARDGLAELKDMFMNAFA